MVYLKYRIYVATKNASRIFYWGGGIFRRATTIMLKGGLNQTIEFFVPKISDLVVALSKLV